MLEMIRNGIIGRVISGLLSFVLLIQPASNLVRTTQLFFLYFASPIELMAGSIEDGQKTGLELLKGYSAPSYDEISGTISFDNADADTYELNELFPEMTTSGDNSSSVDYSDPAADFSSAVTDAQTRLDTEVSSSGDAYRFATETRWEHSHVNLSEDPIFDSVKDLYSTEVPESFGDCETISTLVNTQEMIHVKDIQSCNVAIKPTQECEIKHSYTVDKPIEYVGGRGGIESCGPTCIRMWAGEKIDNSLHGSGNNGQCRVHELDIQVMVTDYTQINSVVLTSVFFENYLQATIDGTVIYQTHGVFPETGQPGCSSGDNGASPNRDVTHLFDHNGLYVLKIRISANDGDDGGEGWGNFNFNYTSDGSINNDVWTPPGCIESAIGVNDGFCSGSVICTDSGVPELPHGCTDTGNLIICDDGDGNFTTIPKTPGCINVDGFEVCENDFANPPIQGISPFCKNVAVKASCDFTNGSMDCYTDMNGDEQCPVNNADPTITNDCDGFETCALLSEECVGNASGDSGACYLYKRRYDCGTDQPVDSSYVEDEIVCSGGISCMGGDCIEVPDERNKDFGKVAGVVAGMQLSDLECAVDGVCKIFNGEEGWCKQAVFGIVDCCEKPEGVSISDYLAIAKGGKMMFEDSALAEEVGSWSSRASGTFSELTQPITDGVNTITEPIMSAWDSTVSEIGSIVFDTTADTAAETIATVQTSAVNASAEFVGEAFGDTVKDAFFSTNSEGVATFSGEGAWAGQMLANVMLVYTWIMIAIAVIKIIYECEEIEMNTMVQNELGNCHYIGDWCESKALGECIDEREGYCCFQTPFARIMQEQVRPQLGMGWGDPESPNCDGIEVSQMEHVNWDEVNLDEWVDTLKLAGQMPTSSSQTQMEQVSNGYSRPVGEGTTAEERADGVVSDTMSTINNNIRDSLWGTGP